MKSGLNFTPNHCSNLEVAAEYSEYKRNPDLTRHVDEFEATLRGQGTTSYQQASWMGRGCYKELAQGSYIFGKGVGSGPGSEEMRIFLDKLWQSRARGSYRGGCVRMETETEYPLLLQFIEDDDGWKVMDPRPEGLSIFGALFREGLSGEIYKKLGVPSVVPLKLFRNKVVPPFNTEQNGIGVETYIRTHIRELLSRYLGVAVAADAPVRFEESTYFDMDGGVLLRHGEVPFRIANLHMAAINSDRDLMRSIVSNAEQSLGGKSVPQTLEGLSPSLKMAWVLGSSAGKLYKNHIIHGQLNIHYQNVSTCGELADFDSTVFLDAFPHLNAIGASAPRTRSSLYTAHMQSILDGEKRFSVGMMPFVQEDFERYVGGGDLSSCNFDKLSANVLGQIYDLYVQALRMIDLMKRTKESVNPETGTVLSDEEIVAIREIFAKGFHSQVKAAADTNFFKSMADGSPYDAFRDSYLDKRGKTTIYGWQYPETPMNHLLENCDSQRLDFTQRDADALFAKLRQLVLKKT